MSICERDAAEMHRRAQLAERLVGTNVIREITNLRRALSGMNYHARKKLFG